MQDLENERDAIPSVDSIKQELGAVKQRINRNKEEIRDCKVRENDPFVSWLAVAQLFYL